MSPHMSQQDHGLHGALSQQIAHGCQSIVLTLAAKSGSSAAPCAFSIMTGKLCLRPVRTGCPTCRPTRAMRAMSSAPVGSNHSTSSHKLRANSHTVAATSSAKATQDLCYGADAGRQAKLRARDAQPRRGMGHKRVQYDKGSVGQVGTPCPLLS
jgi:hypothetical protein